MLILCISTSAIPVVIMTIDKTNLVNDDKPEDLKTLFKTEDSFEEYSTTISVSARNLKQF